jgi:hypothetical protein
MSQQMIFARRINLAICGSEAWKQADSEAHREGAKKSRLSVGSCQLLRVPTDN